MIEALSSEFEVLSEVGRGGMGVVYKARQISLDRIVAIKMLLREFAQDDEFISRFKREARAIATLNHQNIVDIYDIREAGGTWFIITEFVGGGNLRDLLKERKKLELNEACRILYESCSALYYTHKQGVIHRDIKPDNLMFTENLEVKVTDFGLARLSDSTFQTRTGLSMGTPRYMSPEQASGKDTDHRTDIYSLGIMFYEMLTGTVPFEGDNAFAVVFKHINEPPTPPTEVDEELPTWIDPVILRCLEKEKESRYPDCRELGQTLESTVSSAGQASWTTPVEGEVTGGATMQVTMAAKGKKKDKTRIKKKPGKKGGSQSKGLLWGMVGAVVVLAIAAGVAFFVMNQAPSGQPPAGIASLFDQAQQATGAGDWKTAAGLWDRISQETGVDPQRQGQAKKSAAAAWAALASEEEGAGELQTAYSYYGKALERNPEDNDIVSAYTKIRVQIEKQPQKVDVVAEARILVSRGRLADARTLLQELLKGDPENKGAKNLLQQIAEKEKSLAQVNTELEAINKLAKDRNLPQAILACEKLQSSHPDIPTIKDLLADLKRQDQDIKQAQKLYVSARESLQAGKNAKAYSDLQDALVKDPEHKQAADLLKEVEKTVDREDRIRKLREQAKSALAARDYGGAVSKAQEVLGMEPGDKDAEEVLRKAKDGESKTKSSAALVSLKKKLEDGESLLRMGKYDELGALARQVSSATESLQGEEAAKIKADASSLLKIAASVPSLIETAEKGLNSRNLPGVRSTIKACEEVLKLNQRDPVAERLLRMAMQQRADLEGGLEAALAQGKKSYDRLDFDGAKRQFDKALNIMPDHSEASGFIKDIERQLDEITSRRIQGTTWYSQREYGKAKKEFEAVLKILPGDTEAAEMMAKCDEAMDRQGQQPVKQPDRRPEQPVEPKTPDNSKQPDKDPVEVAIHYAPLSPITTWGQGELEYPVDVFASPEAIYVVDATLCKVLRYSLDGEFQKNWGTKTKSLNPLGSDVANGEFSRPWSIAVDKDESVYVLDTKARCVQKFNRDGEHITTFGGRGEGKGGFDVPIAITVGSDGSIFVLDNRLCMIQKFSPDGKFVMQWGKKGSYTKELDDPKDICGSWDGSLFITDTGNGRIQKYGLEGTYITLFELKEVTRGKHEPIGVSVDIDNNIYITDGGSCAVQKWNRMARHVSTWGRKGSSKGLLKSPVGISVSPSGIVLVADPGNSRVERFSPKKQ